MCIFRLFRYLPDLGHYMGRVKKVVISRKNMVMVALCNRADHYIFAL